jgi:hypothetical protein
MKSFPSSAVMLHSTVEWEEAELERMMLQKIEEFIGTHDGPMDFTSSSVQRELAREVAQAVFDSSYFSHRHPSE